MKNIRNLKMGYLLLISLLAALLVHGNEKPLSVRALLIEKSDLPDWYLKVNNQKFEPIQWSIRQPSFAMITQADQELNVYSKKVDQNGKPEFILAKKVAIPEETDEIILLGWLTDNDEEAENAEDANLLAVADNSKNAKFNEWLVINCSDQEVIFRYGKENDAINVESSDAKFYSIKGEPGKGGEVIAEATIKGEMRKIYSTFWSAPDEQRSIIIFYTQDDRPKLRRIIDFLKRDK